MVLKIDTKNKTVEIEGSVNLKEFYDSMKAMFPVTYLDFKITCKWANTSTTVYSPSSRNFYNTDMNGTIIGDPTINKL